MHRTASIDYGIVLEGEVHLVLDDGSATLLHAGDVVIQRGGDHAGENRAATPARMAFMLVDGTFSDESRQLVPPGALERSLLNGYLGGTSAAYDSAALTD